MNVWDLRLKAGHRVAFELPAGHTTSLFVLRGTLDMNGNDKVGTAELAVMEREGSRLEFDVVEDTTLLLLNGEPLNEPIVGHGPFVMNSKAEIIEAINDFNSGRFGQIGA
jgi:redox-sensitive bicupin YhaK (pirin superfamily)